MNLRLFVVLFFICGVAFPGAKSYSEPAPLTLVFGINSTDSPKVIAQKIFPILDVLESDLERRLLRPVKIKFKVFRTYEESIKAFVDGAVDFGRLCPASYVLAKQQNPLIQLLAMENKNGQKRFNGLIIVRKDSSFQNLSDLKATNFAFGNRVSTIGRYLAQLELMKAGVCSKNLKKFDYLHRHDNVFTGVATGRYDAGSLKESTFHKRNEKNKDLRILYSFHNVTKPWLVRGGLDENIYHTLRLAMLDLKDQEAFKKLNIKGFFPSSHQEYKIIEEAMLNTDQFDNCKFAMSAE
ncbi:MAG: PhnD/SsuA/transferrin family substrate-binding protein [Magnetococcales bacterium]|nr:PhnD/SsuA/transferrin family substrate-binding protein [Magnetococcales bacterium]